MQTIWASHYKRLEIKQWLMTMMTMMDDNEQWQWKMTMTDDIDWWQWLTTMTDDNVWWLNPDDLWLMNNDIDD